MKSRIEAKHPGRHQRLETIPQRARTPGKQQQTSSKKAQSVKATQPRPLSAPVLSFQRILVPIDFSAESTQALKTAAAFPQGDGGKMLLLHVVGPVYDKRDYGYGPVQRRRPNEDMMRHARQRLQALGRRHLGRSREWQCTVRSGTAPNEILKAVEEFHADLVIMPTRGLSHAPPTEVGSIAERVVRHAPCPVLVLAKRTVPKGRKD